MALHVLLEKIVRDKKKELDEKEAKERERE